MILHALRFYGVSLFRCAHLVLIGGGSGGWFLELFIGGAGGEDGGGCHCGFSVVDLRLKVFAIERLVELCEEDAFLYAGCAAVAMGVHGMDGGCSGVGLFVGCEGQRGDGNDVTSLRCWRVAGTGFCKLNLFFGCKFMLVSPVEIRLLLEFNCCIQFLEFVA